jgi:glutamate/tyrosine decarboxylase-like PLP-dependent enzyme
MYVSKVCATLMFRDMSLLPANFRVLAPYMRDTGNFINLGEISLHGTRHADVLKLWLSLLHVGRAGFAQIVDHSFDLQAHFVAEIKRRPFLRLAYEPDMNIVCFRSEPSGIGENRLDIWNTNLQDYLLHKGNAFLSLPLLRGRRWLKAVLLNPYLERSMISDIFKHVDAFHTGKG